MRMTLTSFLSKSQMDLNTIMSNIYGESSPQSFDHITLTGGNARRSNGPRIRYVDSTVSPSSQSFRATKLMSSIASSFPSLSGGAKSTDTLTYPSAAYVKDSDLQTFIREFYLHYLVSNAHRNLILVIPESVTLSKMVDDFKAKLRAEGIRVDEPTPEASRYAAKSDLPFKNYIFDVYGKNENDGMPYHIPSTFPDSGETEVLRRTNRLSNIYYFKVSSKSDIKVSSSENMSNAVTLKFVARCDNDVFVLRGDLPKPNESRSSNIVTASSMSGGAIDRRSTLKRMLVKLSERYHDVNQAAYDFIAAAASTPSSIRNIASNYYSGDYLHTALSMIADNTCSLPINVGMSGGNIDAIHSRLIDAYTPRKSNIKFDKVNQVIPAIAKNARKARSGKDANAAFFKTLREMYNTTNAPKWMMYADVATAMCRRNPTPDGLRNAIDAIGKMEAIENGGDGMSGGYSNSTLRLSNHIVSSPFLEEVYGAVSATPFVGMVAREYTPIPMRTYRRSVVRGAFEDAHELDDDSTAFAFKDEADVDEVKDETEKVKVSSLTDENGNPSGKERSEMSGGSIDISQFY